MSAQEIVGIIDNGESQCDISFKPQVKNSITNLAQGFPYYAHLLCLHAALFALRDKTPTVSREHLMSAVARAHQDVDRSIRDAYNTAILSTRQTSFPDVLYAAAKAKSDELGCFSPTDMTAVKAKADRSCFTVNALQYPLSKLISAERGQILKRVGQPRRYKYRFANPMMRQYVLLSQAVQRGEV